MNSSLVCVDASLLVKLVLDDPLSGQAEALWADWQRQGISAVAPVLMPFEVTAALRKYVYHDLITREAAQQSLQAALGMGVILEHSPGLHTRALTLADQFGWIVTYDAHYLALAEQLDCPIWTADRRLVNAVRAVFPDVHWLGEVEL